MAVDERSKEQRVVLWRSERMNWGDRIRRVWQLMEGIRYVTMMVVEERKPRVHALKGGYASDVRGWQ